MSIRKRTSITRQVSLLNSVILTAAVAAMAFAAYWYAATAMDRTALADLEARVKLIEGQLETFDTTARGNAERLSKVFEAMVVSGLRVDASRTVEMGGRSVPVLLGASGPLNQEFREVDEFSRMTGGAATVFARVGDDFMRITTSLKKEDGSRALGTLLGPKHPAYEFIVQGRAYVGEAKLFGRHYMSKYLPVADNSGRVFAILFVGFDITEGLGKLFETLGSARIGQNGYYFVLDASDGPNRGELVVHSKARGRKAGEGTDLTDYAAILDARGGTLFANGHAYVFSEFKQWRRIVGASADMEELHADARTMGKLMLGIGLLVILVVCLSTYGVLARKLRPLSVLADDVARVGDGDLTVRSHVSSNDEVGAVSAAFDKMTDQVQGIVTRVKTASAGIADAVTQLRRESDQVQSGSAHQSEAAMRVASVLEQVSASLSTVSEHARDSRDLSKQTNDLSERGAAVAQRAATETAQIAAAVGESAQTISSLSVRSQQISQVVRVIKDIADQTNLLALNAAIEAARAGEQGRGFAVVADEVRQLAERTSQATVEIGTMIEAIQRETNDAVKGMNTGSDRVQEGVKLVEEAMQALASIRAAANQTLQKASEISSAMAEQSSAGAEASANVERIAAMAEDNNAAVTRNAQTVGRLESLASDLAALTAGLKVA